MDETKHLIEFMEKDLAGIKENMVHGKYSDLESYNRVVGEARNLIKMIDVAKKLVAKRQEYETEDEE